VGVGADQGHHGADEAEALDSDDGLASVPCEETVDARAVIRSRRNLEALTRQRAH